MVAFNFFRKFYNKSEDDDEPDMKCDDMMTVSVHQPWSHSHFGREPRGWLVEQTAVVLGRNRDQVLSTQKREASWGAGGDGSECHHTVGANRYQHFSHSGVKIRQVVE